MMPLETWVDWHDVVLKSQAEADGTADKMQTRQLTGPT
jgi:hypothetical protein